MSSPLSPLPSDLPTFLSPYLPSSAPRSNNQPWVTLTYAQSLDGRIAAAKGTRTTISHPQTKTMTHYIRSKHSAIVVGVDTVIADDPALNCRYDGGSGDTTTTTIRPVVIDPHYRLKDRIPTLKMVINYKSGISLKPLLIVSSSITDTSNDDVDLLKLQSDNNYIPWEKIFNALSNLSLNTIMVEGGAKIINRLLTSNLVNSIIVTIGPLYLGDNAVSVSPNSKVTLKNISWWSGIQDSVLAANPNI